MEANETNPSHPNARKDWLLGVGAEPLTMLRKDLETRRIVAREIDPVLADHLGMARRWIERAIARAKHVQAEMQSEARGLPEGPAR